MPSEYKNYTVHDIKILQNAPINVVNVSTTTNNITNIHAYASKKDNFYKLWPQIIFNNILHGHIPQPIATYRAFRTVQYSQIRKYHAVQGSH
jgi:hypothetical protein